MAPNKKSEDIPDFFVPLGTFDKNRLVRKPAVASSFKKGEAEVESCSSQILYLDDDGKECHALIELAPGFTFGINYVVPFGTPKEEICLEIAEGYQICYSLTSIDTIEKPTKDEKYSINVLKTLQDVAWEALVEECEKDDDEREVPAPTYNSYLGATKGGKENRAYAIKPIFSYPTKKVEGKKNKVEDRSKPLRAYFKFLTFGTGEDMKCSTMIFGPGDKKVSPARYLDKWGTAHPCLLLKDIFWGSHGQKATYGGSVRLRVNDMNFTPQKEVATVKRRLGANTAPAEEYEENSDDSGDDSFPTPGVKSKSKAKSSPKKSNSDDEGFEDGDDDKSPMDALDGDSDEDDGSSSKGKSSKKVVTKKTTKPSVSKKTKSDTKTKTIAEKRKEQLAKRKAAKKSKNEENSD